MLKTALWSGLLAIALATGVADAYMKEGVAEGTVITTGEDRVVVQPPEGGQMTFEAARVKKGEEWVPNEDQLALLKTLKPGDRLRIEWGQDHTGHYYVRSIRKAEERDHPAAGHAQPRGDGSPVAHQLRALRPELRFPLLGDRQQGNPPSKR